MFLIIIDFLKLLQIFLFCPIQLANMESNSQTHGYQIPSNLSLMNTSTKQSLYLRLRQHDGKGGKRL